MSKELVLTEDLRKQIYYALSTVLVISDSKTDNEAIEVASNAHDFLSKYAIKDRSVFQAQLFEFLSSNIFQIAVEQGTILKNKKV